MVGEGPQKAYGPWAGKYEGPNGAIAEIERAFEKREASKSAVSSVYFSYAKALQADVAVLRMSEKEQRELLERADEYGRAALRLSDEYAKGRDLTADECDVRQSVLRFAGKNGKALEVIDEGLQKGEDPHDGIHTQALLLIGKEEALRALGAKPRDVEVLRIVGRITMLVEEVEMEYPLQAIRVYRGLVRYYRDAGDQKAARGFAEHARHLIDITKATDQERKLEADLAGAP